MHSKQSLADLTADSASEQGVATRPYPWKTRILIPAGISAALLAAAGWSARESFLPSTDVRVVPAILKPVEQVMVVQQSDAAPGANVVTQAAGWIEPDPFPIAISALADGVLREVLVLDGQHVKAGEVLARLIDDDARLSLRRAQAELASRQADLSAAQRSWDNPTERRRAVDTSVAMLEESRAELAKLGADVAAERAREDELADLVLRLEQSFAARASGELELVAVKFKLQAQRAQANATEAKRPVLEATIRRRVAEAAAAEENAKLRIEESRALDSAKAAVMLAEAVVDEAKLRLARMEIRSPKDGVIMSRLNVPGGKVILAMDTEHSAHIARLYDPTQLQVRVDVPLADVNKVGVGSTAEISVEALPGRTFRGEVTRMVNEADITKNTIQFKVQIETPDAGLKPEMLARVKFMARMNDSPTTKQSVTMSQLPFVPQALVSGDAPNTTVLLADRRNGVAQRRAITLTDQRQGDWIAVSAGIAAGDDLIAEPTRLADGARIRVIGEMESKGGQ